MHYSELFETSEQLPNGNFLGFRIISHSPDGGYKTLYGQEPFNPVLNKVYAIKGQGLYLGTSKKFCMDYYSGGTDDSDVLLTYEYSPKDLIKGDPTENTDGEVIVSRAKLIEIEHITDDDAYR